MRGILALVLLLLTPGLAGATPATPDEVVQAALRPGWETARGTHMAALEIRLADHWKTYWRAPGDAGIPPRFDWSGSQNLARVAFHWPRPQVFELNGLRSVGYLHDLVLPIEFVPKDPGRPVAVKARVNIGVCNDICVPVEFELSADLAGPGKADPAIRAALARVPVPAAKAGLTRFDCTVRPIKDGLHLTAHIALPPQGAPETALFETSDPSIWVGATSTKREGGELVAGADLVPADSAPFALDRSQLRITVLGQDRAVELDGCPAG
jgi:DsbC/DsbD-like thiol-disulfide interchange protein